MTVPQTTLERAFLEDHRCLTRGFSDLLDALRADDPVESARIADEIDRIAGPHIEFEETVYYPAVSRRIGRENTSQLYDEHHIGLRAVRTLLSRDPERPFAPHEREALIEEAQTALDHAVTCGTLLAHLKDLDQSARTRMLEDLRAARARGRRWSDLPVRSAADDAT
jgi:hypothetical protein